MAEQWEIDLGRQIWDAKTSKDAKVIIDVCEKRYGATPIAIGRENNSGTIDLGSDPGLALIERLTNGIDALIELAVHRNPHKSTPDSPEAAAQTLFGVPTDGLGVMLETERRELAKGLVVGMHDSGIKKRPSIRVTDRGTGQHSSAFKKTLLSLNESNKKEKQYTQGTFGQGGSATLSFSEYVVYCSRRHSSLLKPGESDRVGFTVAYKEETDPETTILPRYVWLVKKDDSPLDLPAEAFPELEHGTRVTHIEYDIQELAGMFTTQMWQFLNNALFEPVLPFILEGDRSPEEQKAGSRVILGNASRLARVDKARGAIKIDAEDTHKIMLKGYGSATVSWWVLGRPEGSLSKSSPADSYTSANSAIVMTLHGQRQATQPRIWLKNTTQLPFIYKNMIVQINTNGLNGSGRRTVYASTRERARISDLSKQIIKSVELLIKDDENLKHLNHLARERKLSESSQVANEKVQKRLGRFVKTKLKDRFKSGSKGMGKSNKGGTGNRNGDNLGKNKNRSGTTRGRDITDTHLGHVPTLIAFESKRLQVVQGFHTAVWVLVNAKNHYLPKHDSELEIKISGTKDKQPFIKSRSILQGGKSRWLIECLYDTPVGPYQLNVTLETANGILKASIPIEVVTPSKPKRAGKGGHEEETGPEIRWVKKGEWEDDALGETFTAKTVGTVAEDSTKTILFVNQDFNLLAKAVGSRNLSEAMMETRRDRYLYPVACGLWLQHHESQRLHHDDQPSDEYREGEMARLAEAVLTAADPDVDLASEEGDDDD